jgi:inorganic phosphate transporter, PiT family
MFPGRENMLDFFHQIPWYFWAIVLTALAFDFANGWHDTANAVATAISTRVLQPGIAIILSALLNFAGALLSTKVAKTVGGGIVDPSIIQGIDGSIVIFTAMVSAIFWEIYTVLKGLPVSGSHALIGGLIGGGIALYGVEVVVFSGLIKIFIAMLVSPILGGLFGYIILKISYFFAARCKPKRVQRTFSLIQIFTASMMSLMHGQNDAQKVMGVITLLLFTGGYYGAVPFSQVHVPIWVILACAISMAFGTLVGGRAVIKTLGRGLSHLRPIEGASAEFSASLVLEGAAALGIPVSTTHTITGSIVGVGTAKRMKAVKWAVGVRILYTWIFTLPVTASLSAIMVLIIKLLMK